MAQGSVNSTFGLVLPLAVASGGTGASTSTGSGANVLNTSPSITTPVITGVTNASSASAGMVGEYLSATVLMSAPVSLAAWGVPQNVTTLSLSAGDWDVYANVTISGSTNAITGFVCAASLISATYPDAGKYAGRVGGSGTIIGHAAPMLRVNISSTTTIYLVVYVEGSGGPNNLAGQLQARRVR